MRYVVVSNGRRRRRTALRRRRRWLRSTHVSDCQRWRHVFSRTFVLGSGNGFHNTAATTTRGRRLCGWLRSGRSCVNGGCGASSATCRCGSGCSGPSSFLALPPRSDTGDLIVRERCHVSAHRHIHLPEESYHLIDGYSEFASHVVHEKLAQNTTSLIPGGSVVEPAAHPFQSRRLSRESHRGFLLPDLCRSLRLPPQPRARSFPRAQPRTGR